MSRNSSALRETSAAEIIKPHSGREAAAARNLALVKAQVRQGNLSCVVIAEKGITTSTELRKFLSLALKDMAEGNLSPMVAHAFANIAGKLIKAKELTLKYGPKAENLTGDVEDGES